MAGDRQIKFQFTGDGGVLKGSVGELRALFGNLVNDVDDIRTAGEKWADAYSQQSSRIKQDMDDVETTARVLADSLGPQMVQALDQSGRSVEQQVQELVKLGLTHDDIRMSSDQLAAALKQRDDVLRQSAGEVGDGLRKVADEADSSRSVLANMVGNSAQDLGELAGISGTLGMSLGQLAEYAADGSISLSGLAKMAGPMLGLGLAMGIANKIMGDQQRKAEELRRETEALETARQALADGEQRRAAQSLLDEFEDEIDAAERYGLTTDQALQAVVGMGDGLDILRGKLAEVSAKQDEMRRNGGSYTFQEEQAIYQQVEGLEALVGTLERSGKGFTAAGDDVSTYNTRLESLTDMLGGTTTAEQRHAEALEASTQAAKDAEQAQRDMNDARLASIDSGFAVVDAQDRFTTALERSRETTNDSTTDVDELRQAQDEAARSALGLAEAVAADAEAKAAANGQTLTATESTRLMIASLRQALVTVGPDSPLRAAIQGYINTLQGVPKSATTAVGVTGTEDSLDRIGGVKRSADDLADTEIDVDAAATVDKAVAEVDRLQVKIGDTPETVSTTFVMNTGSAMSALEALRQKMLAVKSAADAAERAVARVAD